MPPTTPNDLTIQGAAPDFNRVMQFSSAGVEVECWRCEAVVRDALNRGR